MSMATRSGNGNKLHGNLSGHMAIRESDLRSEMKDPRDMKDRELKRHLCDVGSAKTCAGCQICGYGREWARRAEQNETGKPTAV